MLGINKVRIIKYFTSISMNETILNAKYENTNDESNGKNF